MARVALKAWLAERILAAFDSCVFCGIKRFEVYQDRAVVARLEVEHIVPVSRGGSNDTANLTVACRRCNRRKGTKTATEFGFASVRTAADAFGDA